MSAALAGRTGICGCCGTEFNLKRTTAKVCSDRCRKQLQRKPELADQHLHDLLPELDDRYDEWCERDKAAVAVVMDGMLTAFTGKPGPSRQETAEAEAASKELRALLKPEKVKRCLHQVAATAPALAAWLQQQPEEKVEAIFTNRREALPVLGEALVKQLRGAGLMSR